MNIGLALFNLIPIPPLDGSHIMENLLPYEMSVKYQRIGRYGLMVLFLAILLDSFAGTQILTAILIYPMFWIAKLFAGKNLIWLMQTLR
jgi:Zn-dependent protease